MTALTADRRTPTIQGVSYEYPAAASVTAYVGALIVLDASGNAEPGTTATGKVAVGRCVELADNSSGAAADINIKVEVGVALWVNGDTITKTSIGDTAYVVDDQTVSKAGSGKSACGIIVDVDSDGVWVDTRPQTSLGSTGLLAANNLSDVGTVATARANLALDTADDPTFNDLTLDGTLAVTGLTTLTGGITGDVVATGKVDATNLYTDKVAIPLAEMIDLVANPKTLVAAQGANKVIEFVSAMFQLNYGAAVFTESSDDLQIAYVDGSGQKASPVYETTGSFLVAAAEAFGFITANDQFLTGSVAQVENVPLVLMNTSGDFGGGTGSTVDVFVTYRVHDVS